MKCDNCGKEEVNFHYTSNINGNITEKHLCAECAVELGLDTKLGIPGFAGGADRSLMRQDASFEEIFADLFGARPTRRMLGGYGLMFPTFVIPTVGMFVPNAGAGAETAGTETIGPEKQAEIKVEVDGEMKKRREINMLREQMHQAAAAEDFEKAAGLRDSIKKLESGLN